MSISFGPGVHDITEHDYFAATGALSCSGAKLLLPPSCPALFKYRQDHPEHKRAWDFGSAAHRMVLGQGADFIVIDADNYRTKDAQDAAKTARAAGAAPVLNHEYEQIKAMAAAIRAHPLAGPLLDPARGGQPERSLFWVDADTGVHRRARIDWLPEPFFTSRFIITDYKTCEHADRASIRKAIANYGYYQQDDWYSDGVRALGLDPDPAFLFVFQEKKAPYLVNVAQIEPEDRAVGRARNRQAIERFRDCTEADMWPGYEADTYDGITYVSLPPWTARAQEVSP